jgi:dTMP kinase
MFITFEGIDFCGKSTQTALLKNYLTSINRKVELIREPGGTLISDVIRNILLDTKNFEMVMEAEIFLFSAARAQLVREKIRPYLKDGIYVISDRFFDSTTAYQGYGRGISVDIVDQINKLAVGDTLPDITFFIDIPIEEAEKRKSLTQNIALDRIEVSEKDFYERVRKGYLKIAATQNRFKIIDGMQTVENIHLKIIEEISLFENKELV